MSCMSICPDNLVWTSINFVSIYRSCIAIKCVYLSICLVYLSYLVLPVYLSNSLLIFLICLAVSFVYSYIYFPRFFLFPSILTVYILIYWSFYILLFIHYPILLLYWCIFYLPSSCTFSFYKYLLIYDFLSLLDPTAANDFMWVHVCFFPFAFRNVDPIVVCESQGLISFLGQL